MAREVILHGSQTELADHFARDLCASSYGLLLGDAIEGPTMGDPDCMGGI
jgi:hypothetical protein